ncbi:MAG TPA: hypothetical protein VHF58_02110 [Solirubrobacterales bacterium]|nr:hypothetical protein [Solirubrobacterales bacterium]
MFRKLIALSLIGAGVAAALKKRNEAASASGADAGGGAAGAGEAAPAGGGAPQTADADDLAQVRAGQTEATIEAPIAGAGGDEQAAIPDVSDDDPIVREQEQAAAEDAGSIGGPADSATADTDPAMRPVYEGSGGDQETFETTEDQGR